MEKEKGTDITTANQYGVQSIERMFEIAEHLVKSQMCPFKKPEDVVLVMQAGSELGIGYIQAIGNLYPINGRVTMGVHLRSALIGAEKNISISVIEDFVKVYYFKAKGGYELELTADELKEGILSDKYQIVTVDTAPADYVASKIQLFKIDAPYMPVDMDDRRTTIEFHLKDKGIKERVTYHLHEAVQAGLPANNPNTWVKYTRAMVYKSCFNRGSDRYCSNILKGIKDTGEMLDVTQATYEIDGKGEVVSVNGKPFKVTDDMADFSYDDVTYDKDTDLGEG